MAPEFEEEKKKKGKKHVDEIVKKRVLWAKI